MESLGLQDIHPKPMTIPERYGARMAHNLISARITFGENRLPISEVYLEAVFLLHFTTVQPCLH